MKRIEKEIVTRSTRVVFEAYDGTQFSNVDDCNAYENNAKGVLGKRAEVFRVARTTEYMLYKSLGYGSDEECIEIYRPQNAKDIETLNLYMNIYYKDAKLITDSYIGEKVILHFSYDKDWVEATTLEEQIEMFRKNFDEIINKENNGGKENEGN